MQKRSRLYGSTATDLVPSTVSRTEPSACTGFDGADGGMDPPRRPASMPVLHDSMIRHLYGAVLGQRSWRWVGASDYHREDTNVETKKVRDAASSVSLRTNLFEETPSLAHPPLNTVVRQSSM